MNEIIHIDQDKNSDLWVSTKKSGGFFYKGSDLTSKPVRFLNGASVSSVMVDREGTIWATTLEKGVFVSYSKALIALKRQNDLIGNIQVDSDQVSMLCSSKKIAYFFRKDSLQTDIIQDSLPRELTALFRTKNSLYLGTKSGLFYAPSKKRVKIVFGYPAGTAGVLDIIKYNGDTLLVLGWNSIYTVYHEKRISNYTLHTTINFTTILKDGSILVTTRNNDGVYLLKNNTFVPYLPELPQLRTRINAIVEDHNSRLWFATETNLYCYDEHHHLHQFNEKNGLANLQISTLAVDEANNIWGGTSLGLFKISSTTSLNKLSITYFNEQHGLPDLRIEKIAAFDNKIWCLTRGYVFYFPSRSMIKNTSPPLVNIPTVFINGKQFPYTDSLIVNHNENNILIQPTSSSYKSSEKKGFIYKLNEYDTEWHFSAIPDIKYTNLDHGSYTLFIYGLNNDNFKSNKPATFTLIIKPPFWLTWWFITLLVILFLFLIYLSARFWQKKIEKKERDKAATNQKMAEFKMTALRSQMNPHFIFNAIGSIQHFILKNEAKQSYNYLAKFSMLIRNILNNSKEEYISLSQEINTLKLYIELEQIRFTHPFKFIIDIDDEIDMDVDIPTMLIQPYIENSIWHGLMPKKGEGVLELIFKEINSTIHVTIRDNGVGRKIKGPNQQHISKGLSITEQRIETLEATSQKKFDTKIIDLKDEQGNPIGTEVNLIIPFDK